MRNKDNEWKDSDVAVLKESYGNYSINEIAEMLGRSEMSIRRKALNIGLHRPQTIARRADKEQITRESVIGACRKQTMTEEMKKIGMEIIQLEDERAEIDRELARLNKELNDLINQMNMQR